tara:strand:- start:353 stop:553 length:201 start_codon:yes stop_codon:yes gene_type:complete
MIKKTYKSVSISEDSHSKLKEIAELENRTIGRELSGLIKSKYHYLKRRRMSEEKPLVIDQDGNILN